MVSSERPGITPSGSTRPASPSRAGDDESASFAIGELRVDFIAAPGAARLVAAVGNDREVWVVEPIALEAWARQTSALLGLGAASDASSRAEFRAPFLIDREGRPSIAVEGLVSEHGVSYRLLVTGAAARIAGLMSDAETVRGMVEAASGAAAVART